MMHRLSTVFFLALILAACGGGSGGSGGSNTPSTSSNTNSNTSNGNNSSGSGGTTTPTPTPSPEPAPAPAPGGSSEPARWKPGAQLRWQIQFTGSLDTSLNVDVYDIDLFDRSKSDIDALHKQGKKVICYFSAGSWEDWRPDAGDFPESVKGKNLGDWPGEKWLDIRNVDGLAPVMKARFDLAKNKGCDGIDVDNLDGYTQNSGFSMTAAQQLTYNRFLATEAHKRGLAIGLKNDVEQADDLAGAFDYAINEVCFEWNECKQLEPFTRLNKPVFHIEYTKQTSEFCKQANDMNFNSIRKNRELDAYVEFCR